MSDDEKPLMGRRTSCTKEIADLAGQLAGTANSNDMIAKAIGISRETFYEWMARGRKERQRLQDSKQKNPKPSRREAPFLYFLEQVDSGRSKIDNELIQKILGAANDPRTWQAAAWLLERRDPAHWGRTNRENAQQAQQNNTGAVQNAIDKLVEGPGLKETK
jgi:transposase